MTSLFQFGHRELDFARHAASATHDLAAQLLWPFPGRELAFHWSPVATLRHELSLLRRLSRAYRFYHERTTMKVEEIDSDTRLVGWIGYFLLCNYKGRWFDCRIDVDLTSFIH